MSFQIIVNINGVQTVIDDDYIIQATSIVTNKTKFNFDDMIAATTEFILDCTDGLFNPDNSGSIFYGDDWYNQQVSIYSNDILVWDGLLKKIKYSGRDRKLTVKTKNYIQEIIDKECSLVRGTGSSENITPAEIILEILTDWVEIPDSHINRIGFNNGISYQDSINAYVELRLGQENSTNASEIILELCRITGAYLYAEDNVINYFQPQEYAGELGEEIKSSDIIEKTFKLSYDDKEVVNYASIFCKGVNNPSSVFLKNSPEYRFEITMTTSSGSATGTVTYFEPTGTNGLPANAADYLKKGYLINNGDDSTPSVPPYSTIVSFDIDANTITFSENATQTGSDGFIVSALEPVNDTYSGNHVFDSFDKYALKSYKLVKDTPSSDTNLISSHKIIFKSFDYADNVINLKTLLNTGMKKYAEFSLDYNKNYIRLNDQLDLTFDYYIKEPVRIITKKVDTKKKKISVRCEFINSPYEYYARDTTLPENFPIFSFFYDTNKIVVLWDKQDVNYYKIYFGSNDTYYNGVSAEGFSPLVVSSPSENNNNQYYKLLTGLTEYFYYIKATGIDTSENESDYSNIPVPINIALPETYEKRYKITPESEIYLGIQAQSSLDYNVITETRQPIYGDSEYGDSEYGLFRSYEIDWLPPAMNYYDGLNYDSDTLSFLGVWESQLIGSNRGFNSIIWKLSEHNEDVYIQYRTYNLSTSTFSSWSSLVNSTNRYFVFNPVGFKAVQFRIYIPDDSVIVYLENLTEI